MKFRRELESMGFSCDVHAVFGSLSGRTQARTKVLYLYHPLRVKERQQDVIVFFIDGIDARDRGPGRCLDRLVESASPSRAHERS